MKRTKLLQEIRKMRFEDAYGAWSERRLTQEEGAARNLYLEDPGEAPVDSWMGQSFARWEGDTLVVEVTGQNDQTWFDRSGNHHSESLKVTERYSLQNAHVLDYRDGACQRVDAAAHG